MNMDYEAIGHSRMNPPPLLIFNLFFFLFSSLLLFLFSFHFYCNAAHEHKLPRILQPQVYNHIPQPDPAKQQLISPLLNPPSASSAAQGFAPAKTTSKGREKRKKVMCLFIKERQIVLSLIIFFLFLLYTQ
jgi:heme/copper-type cytochrome/quinol oxidase subunit 3